MEESSEILLEILEQPEKESSNAVLSEETANELSEEELVNVSTISDESMVPKQSSSEIPNKPVRLSRLPFAKIKNIMKMDPDVILVQQEAVVLVSKATEMFIEFLTRESNKQLAGNKRKTVMKRDVDVTIESIPQLCFLDGALE